MDKYVCKNVFFILGKTGNVDNVVVLCVSLRVRREVEGSGANAKLQGKPLVNLSILVCSLPY